MMGVFQPVIAVAATSVWLIREVRESSRQCSMGM